MNLKRRSRRGEGQKLQGLHQWLHDRPTDVARLRRRVAFHRGRERESATTNCCCRRAIADTARNVLVMEGVVFLLREE